MEKSIIEELKDIKVGREIASVNFFNDGSVRTDDRRYVEGHIDDFNKSVNGIKRVLSDATYSYSNSFEYEFDSIYMNMLFGLIYDVNDVIEDNIIKPNAMPKDKIVRYYTDRINSYLDGNKTNCADYYCYGVNNQGTIDYEQFVEYVQKNGLVFNGPQSFEELKNAILSNEKFDITIGAEFEKQKTLVKRP